MKIKDIKFGDIVTYRSGRSNNVNKPYKYQMWYNADFKNKSKNYGSNFDIMTIKRYKKFLFFYILKTVYKRGE